MDLDETWQVGLTPEKTKPCTFPVKSCYGFRREREKMGRRGVFCDIKDAPLLPLSLDRFPQNFLRTRVRVVAHDTWFHIPEKFPLRDRICRKTVFLGSRICDLATVTVNVLWCLDCFHPLVDIPQMCLTWVTFAEGCTVFQLSTSERLPLPRYQEWRNQDADIFFKHTRQGAPRSDRRFTLVHCCSAHFLVRRFSRCSVAVKMKLYKEHTAFVSMMYW